MNKKNDPQYINDLYPDNRLLNSNFFEYLMILFMELIICYSYSTKYYIQFIQLSVSLPLGMVCQSKQVRALYNHKIIRNLFFNAFLLNLQHSSLIIATIALLNPAMMSFIEEKLMILASQSTETL
ncbi:hypothetical protein pb186bvf_021138 [Paramecium bursaria]